MKFLAWVLILAMSLSYADQDWIHQQVVEDLAETPYASFNSQDLRNLFKTFDQKGCQALYISIRNNQVTAKSTIQTDRYRNPRIANYLLGLARRHKLPDTEFILFTYDGLSDSFPFPVFSFCKNSQAKNVCLFPDFEMFWELADRKKNWGPICQSYANSHPWMTKKPIAFFRGASTGRVDPSLPYFGNDRLRLTKFSLDHPSLVDATLSQVWEPKIRDFLSSIGKEIMGADIETHFHYKYLFDVDGNGATFSRCRWILLSNSVLLKMMADHSQWYYKALQPYVHFVPIKSDLSDLTDALEFLKTHDTEARQIADQGSILGSQIFSLEAVDQYVVDLLENYAKRMR